MTPSVCIKKRPPGPGLIQPPVPGLIQLVLTVLVWWFRVPLVPGPGLRPAASECGPGPALASWPHSVKFQGASGTELELETGSVGFQEPKGGTGTVRTVFQEPQPGPSVSVKRNPCPQRNRQNRKKKTWFHPETATEPNQGHPEILGSAAPLGALDIPAQFPGHPRFLPSKPKEDKLSRAGMNFSTFRPPPLRVGDPHPIRGSPDPTKLIFVLSFLA